MSDDFRNLMPGLTSPATRLTAVTPDDGADLPIFSRALAATTAGLVRVTTVGGDTGDIFLNAGVAFPIRVQRVWATGTTAGGIVGLS